jgi:hypothetical protein
VNLGNNWWGDASGPFNANSNPNGQGNSVDDGVSFDPIGTTDLCPQQPPSNPPPATSGGEPAGLPLTSLIPVTGGDLVALDCTLAELITLRLENNNEATFTCNVGGQAGLNEEFIETLPGKLPTGASFVTGFTTLVLTDNLPILNLPPTSHGTVSFVVPTGVDGNTLAILYWDETLNKGFGGWVTLKDPTLYDGRLSATVTYTGTFALVSK